MYVHRPWDSLEDSDRPHLEKCWFAWVRADSAVRKGDLGTASGWLAVAGRLLAESSDALCSAEVSATRAHLLEAAGEFRDAIDHASAAFEKWSGFAENITNWDELESVRALLRVIAGPDDDLDLDDQRMQFEWMADRLSPRVLASAKAVIRLCAPLGNPRPERCRLRTFRARSTNSLKILSWVLS